MKRGHQLAKEMDLKKDKKALRVIYDLVPRATRESFSTRPQRPLVHRLLYADLL